MSESSKAEFLRDELKKRHEALRKIRRNARIAFIVMGVGGLFTFLNLFAPTEYPSFSNVWLLVAGLILALGGGGYYVYTGLQEAEWYRKGLKEIDL